MVHMQRKGKMKTYKSSQIKKHLKNYVLFAEKSSTIYAETEIKKSAQIKTVWKIMFCLLKRAAPYAEKLKFKKSAQIKKTSEK